VDEIRIKGTEQPLAIVEVLRDGASMTIAATLWRGPGSGERYLRCRLRLGDTAFTLDAARPSFTVGRLDHCDLCLPHSCVSREHARLEYQKGRIIIIDQSTNGTYISEAAAPEPVLVHREQRWLRDRGLLRFGSREDDGRGLTLQYACETLGPEPEP
jgi:pSer/pThr/pTyr-binding forkhead associated (FHA) protein